MLPGKLLYWGDNGVHEFWESVDHELLIFRNHAEAHWSAHRNYGFLFFCHSHVAAAGRLSAVIANTHTWVKKNEQFVLEPVSSNQQRSLNLQLTDAKTGDN